MADPIIIERRVSSGLDDAEQKASGTMSLTGADLELIDDPPSRIGQTVGVRFTAIDIPQGAIITAAYIQFQVDEVGSGAASLLIQGEDVDDAAAFADVSNNISSRARTDAAAAWSPEAWTTVGAAGLAQRTSDLSAIVQEIVGRGGWSALNDMAFIITGTGTRTAEAFEGGAAKAPLLHIEYVMPTGGNAAPTLDLDGSTPGTGYAATFTENSSGVAIAGLDVLIADTDDTNLERATITLTNAQAGDQLVVNTAGLPPGITVAPTSTGTNVILTGSASIDAYDAALQQVSFKSNSETPATVARTINVTVNDGIVDSNIAFATIAIDRAPDAVGDSATTVRNTAVTTANVLQNDDQGDAPATISDFAAVSAGGGTVVHNGNGTFTYTPAAGFTGADTFGYTIADADGDTSSAMVTVTVTSGAPIVIEKRVASGLDDAEQRVSGQIVLDSGDLNMANDGTKVQTVGIRFTDIDIPQGAIITSAYLQFRADEADSGATSLLIRGEDADNAAAFANLTNNVSSRTQTDAAVGWSPAAWTTVGEAGLAQRTPDLSGIVQEVVGRAGWSALNDMAFIITGTGTRTAESFEGGAAKAPLLHIEYVVGGPPTEPGVGSISIDDVAISEGDGGTKTATFTVSRTGSAAFTVDYTTANGTAQAGSDYVAKSGTLNFAENQASQTIGITINGDTTVESNEAFFINLTNASGGTIVDSQGQGTITDDDGTPPILDLQVLHLYSIAPFGAADPSGMAYVPSMNTIFVADSEHDESPFNSSLNLFAFRPDGTFISSHSLTGFTREPTGLAYSPKNGLLYITDDDLDKVFWVDPANPSVKLGEFSVRSLGMTDAEDPKIDPVTGNIYMLDGVSRTLFELSATGALVRSFALPSALTDAEALAYDSQNDVFFVASGANRGTIFEIDGDGNLLASNSVLNSFLNPNGNSKPRLKGFELAPSSDPNDGDQLSLYAVDYGADQQSDGRMFEIHLGSDWLVA